MTYAASTAQVRVADLDIGQPLHDFIVNEALPGTGVDPDTFWDGLSRLIHEFGPRKNLPPYICIPRQPNEFAGAGYLSTAYGPFSIGSDPASSSYAVRDLNLPEGVSEERFKRRRDLGTREPVVSMPPLFLDLQQLTL